MTAFVHQSPTPTIPPNTRCDRCYSAMAAVRATFRAQGTLYFCGHHYRESEVGLYEAALAIEDERPIEGRDIPSRVIAPPKPVSVR